MDFGPQVTNSRKRMCGSSPIDRRTAIDWAIHFFTRSYLSELSFAQRLGANTWQNRTFTPPCQGDAAQGFWNKWRNLKEIPRGARKFQAGRGWWQWLAEFTLIRSSRAYRPFSVFDLDCCLCQDSSFSLLFSLMRLCWSLIEGSAWQCRIAPKSWAVLFLILSANWVNLVFLDETSYVRCDSRVEIQVARGDLSPYCSLRSHWIYLQQDLTPLWVWNQPGSHSALQTKAPPGSWLYFPSHFHVFRLSFPHPCPRVMNLRACISWLGTL